MTQEDGSEQAGAAEEPLPEADDGELLKARLEEAEREGGQFRDLLQRVQADSLNYKRRVEEEREEVHRRANADLVLKLLPVLDNYERALQNIPDVDSLQSWVAGIDMVFRTFKGVLESFGVTPIGALGESFDPLEHEAVLHEARDDQEEGKVASVVREGYKLYGRVLRPAQVVVSKKA